MLHCLGLCAATFSRPERDKWLPREKVISREKRLKIKVLSANIVLLNIAKGSKKYLSNERQHIVELALFGFKVGLGQAHCETGISSSRV